MKNDHINIYLLTPTSSQMERGPIFFYKHMPKKTEWHVFSQWYPSQFEEGGVTFNNAEQYMMAHKALLFKDNYHYEKIMESTDPSVIKNYGKRIKNFNQSIWNKYKFEIVTQGNRLKFQQNSDLMEILMKTNGKMLVEASPYDKIWGIGLSESKAVQIPQDEWPGQNLLGKALMKVRNEN